MITSMGLTASFIKPSLLKCPALTRHQIYALLAPFRCLQNDLYSRPVILKLLHTFFIISASTVVHCSNVCKEAVCRSISDRCGISAGLFCRRMLRVACAEMGGSPNRACMGEDLTLGRWILKSQHGPKILYIGRLGSNMISVSAQSFFWNVDVRTYLCSYQAPHWGKTCFETAPYLTPLV